MCLGSQVGRGQAAEGRVKFHALGLYACEVSVTSYNILISTFTTCDAWQREQGSRNVNSDNQERIVT